jgi:hypothetical protein
VAVCVAVSRAAPLVSAFVGGVLRITRRMEVWALRSQYGDVVVIVAGVLT